MKYLTVTMATIMATTIALQEVERGAQLRIYVARHGQDEDNANGILNGHRDQPLTKLGEEQAQIVANKIQNYQQQHNDYIQFDAVYSSPLQRSRRTAEILISHQQHQQQEASANNNNKNEEKGIIKVEILDGLIERDFGIMTGIPTNEIPSRCKADNIPVIQTSTICYFLSPKGAETFPDLIERANKVLQEIQQRHETTTTSTAAATGGDNGGGSSKSILLVTHGDFGKMLYATYYKLDWQDVLRQFHFGNSEILLLSPAVSPENAHIFQVDQYNH